MELYTYESNLKVLWLLMQDEVYRRENQLDYFLRPLKIAEERHSAKQKRVPCSRLGHLTTHKILERRITNYMNGQRWATMDLGSTKQHSDSREMITSAFQAGVSQSLFRRD